MKQVWEPALDASQSAAEQGDGRVTVAVAGIGRWGTNVLRAASNLQGFHVSAVADPSAAPNSDWRRFTTLELLLQREHVEAVLIATPPEAHFAHARAALEAGCHVFVEKPLARSVAEAVALVDLARDRDRCLMVGHILRYHPRIAAMRELLLSGELGRPVEFRSLRHISRRSEEDPWWCLAPHDLSLFEYLLGSRIRRVACRHEHRRVVAELKADSALTGTVDVGVGEKRSQITVVCEYGCVEFSGQRPSLLVSRGSHQFEISVPEFEPLRLELQHFATCIRQQRAPLTDGSEGARVVRVLCAGEASRASGGLWRSVSGS
ncbi:MAG: Gfo/Idh/MocA family protein [Polyangiaceae bacterium]